MADGYLVTTVRRGGALQASGELLLVDAGFQRAERILSVPLPLYPHLDVHKAYGGKRGFRGVRAWQGTIVVAIFDSLLVLDDGGRVLERITHPWLCDIHGI